MTAIFIPELPYKLIQAIRLAHALMETEYELCIPKEHAFKFATLKELFGARFRVGTDGATPISEFAVTHPEPTTSFGSLTRPLIFPHAIPAHCKKMWPDERPVHTSFAGLVTGKRTRLIGDWCQRNIPEAGDKIPNLNPFFHKLLNKFKRKLGLTPKSYSVEMGKLLLWSSMRGRAFPIKSWDQEYYELMARSQFVLCPSGVHVWSYRFFEAMLCGAMPVVEGDCPAYKGFTFYSMKDSIDKLEWDPAVVQRNFDLCVERITIPVAELSAEVKRLITKD